MTVCGDAIEFEAMKISFLVFLLGIGCLRSEDVVDLPPELRTLQKNYDAAIERAKKPITHTYLQELERLKLKYGRNGLPKNALAVESVMDELQKNPDDAEEVDPSEIPVSKMSLKQFKDWLSTVAIVELEGPYEVIFYYDGKLVTTTRPSRPGEVRTHEDSKIDIGTLFVPFTSMDATITISPSRDSAKVSYTNIGKIYQAKIVPRE